MEVTCEQNALEDDLVNRKFLIHSCNHAFNKLPKWPYKNTTLKVIKNNLKIGKGLYSHWTRGCCDESLTTGIEEEETGDKLA